MPQDFRLRTSDSGPLYCFFHLDDLPYIVQKPWIDPGQLINLIDAHSLPHGFGYIP